MKKIPLLLYSLLHTLAGFAQFTETFADGNFTSNPAWAGNTSDWLVNSTQRLQSNSSNPNSQFYLSTPNTLAIAAQWEWQTELAFNPSSANYVDVFLTASAADPSAAATTGYFIRMGGTDDEICLYRKDGSGTPVKIIDGQNGILNNTSNLLRIKVVRNSNQQWTLLRDMTGSGGSYTPEGSVTDATYTSSAYFCILVRQSTASFFQRHFFDDIDVKPYIPDTSPPQLLFLQATGMRTLDLLFDEPVTTTSSQQVLNYTVSNGLGYPAAALRDPANTALVHLLFTGNFPADTPCTLNISGIADTWLNTTPATTRQFTYHPTRPYDIVMDELMADPAPPVALPLAEWIELKNTSAYPISLSGFAIRHPGGQTGSLPAITILPDSFVIVSGVSVQAQLQSFGKTIGISGFPALDNDGDELELLDGTGKTIHHIRYTDKWYGSELKKAGGWSLEMIDAHNPCTGQANWRASTAAAGGTPGKKNAVESPNTDREVPQLLRAYTTDSLHAVLVFDEPLDSAYAARTALYTCSPGIGTPDTVTVMPFFNQVRLRLHQPLQRNRLYQIAVNTIRDCAGNASTVQQARCGLAAPADSPSIVINELLFNPRPGGVDYIELYNPGTATLNLKDIYLAGRNNNGQLTTPVPLVDVSRLFFPGDYMLLSEDPALIRTQYICKDTTAIIQVKEMPAMPDDKGWVVLQNVNGQILDQVNYSEKWHFRLISNPEGVALERIDAGALSQNAENWYSAATHTGYGTPTYKNSQYRSSGTMDGEMTVQPAIFSPNQDGRDDIALINYRFPQPGYVASMTVFDFAGRSIRLLRRNALCGTTGSFRWDGLDDRNQPLPSGIYIVYAEVFHPGGTTRRFKQTVVLAR